MEQLPPTILLSPPIRTHLLIISDDIVHCERLRGVERGEINAMLWCNVKGTFIYELD
jgi:hypothetical protein